MNKHTLKNEFLQVEYLTDALRISGLIPNGQPNLLADMTDVPPIPTPYGDFHFHGGHRLWHSPEAIPRTYIPDAGGLTITEIPNGVILESATEPGTGIRKRIEVTLSAEKASLTLVHTLTNDGLWPVELAPWAITQFRLGGTLILPLPVENADPDGLLPNRHFSLWPYTFIKDPRLKLTDDFIFFEADALLPPFKLGYFNQHGWMAYWLDGILFRKTFDVQAGVPHPDNNSNAEIYCNDLFVEIETLAPLIKLDPAASVIHRETWEVFYGLDALPADARQLMFLS